MSRRCNAEIGREGRSGAKRLGVTVRWKPVEGLRILFAAGLFSTFSTGSTQHISTLCGTMKRLGKAGKTGVFRVFRPLYYDFSCDIFTSPF